MAYASITYTSASGTTFALTNSSGDPIEYLRQSDIAVTVNGTLKTQGTDYTFNSAGTAIVLATAVSGATVVISRTTSITDATVSFTAGSTLTAQDLNNSDKQNRFALQEFSDTYGAITTGTGDLSVLGGFIGSAETWLSDNAHTATTGAIDVRVDSKIDTALTGDVVAGNAITITDNSPASGQITIAVTDGAIEAAELASNAVTTAKIADSNVTTAKINDAAVTTAKINDSAVTTAKLADDSVTSAKIADGTIIAGDIAANAVTTAKILDANVTTAKIADSAVTNAKLATDSVTQAKMADNSVGTAEIIDGAVTNAKLADADLQTLAGSQAGAAAAFALLTSTEVATLDGITSTTSELNILDGVTANASELNTLDGITASTSELNQLDGITISSTLTPANTGDVPTSSAINTFVSGLLNALGGFVAIPDEVSFPNTNPDPSDDAGTVVSISDAGGVVVNASGESTTGRTLSGSTVTITGFPTALRSQTLPSGMGLQVQTTSTLNSYTYHKVIPREADVIQLSDDINDFFARYRVGSSNPTTDLDAGDLFFNTGTGKMLVYDGTTSAWEEVQSIGNFYINTLSSSAGTGGGSASFNGTAYRFTLSNPPTFAQQLIVSINGVVQKPNSGTAQPTEGFAIDGSDIIFGAAPASGSAFFIITMGSTVNIGTPSDNTVTAAKIVDGTITNAKISSTAAIAGTKISPNFGAQNLVVDTDTLFVDATNNRVGIGTSSPSSLLHIGGNNGIRFGAGGTPEAEINYTSAGSEFLDLKCRGTNNTVGNIRFFTGNTSSAAVERMIITSAGNVGIGSTAPKESIDCRGAAVFSGDHVTSANAYDTAHGIMLSSTSGLATIKGVTNGANSVAIRFVPLNSGSGSEAARFDASGRLLVGTSSGYAIFNNSTDNPKFQFRQTSGDPRGAAFIEDRADANGFDLFIAKSRGGSGTTIVNSGDQIGSIQFSAADGTNQVTAAEIRAYVDGTPGADDMPGRLVFSTTADGASSPTERMRIQSDGTVYFGPGSGSTLNSAAFIPDGSLSPYLSFDTNYGGGTKTNVEFRRNGTTAGSITSTSTTTAYNTSSDYRLKENITLVTDGIARLQQLKPSRFNFKVDPTNTVDGFIAHEVQAVVPEAITGEKDAVDAEGVPIYQGIDQSKLVPLLTAALQELVAEVESLKAEVAALKAQ